MPQEPPEERKPQPKSEPGAGHPTPAPRLHMAFVAIGGEVNPLLLGVRTFANHAELVSHLRNSSSELGQLTSNHRCVRLLCHLRTGQILRVQDPPCSVLASGRMAHVVFALGDRPGLSQDEALELGELLARKRSLAAQSASRKIRLEANHDPDRGEKSKDIELSREELEALEAVLDEVRDQEGLPRFERLRNEVLQALREGPPPSGRLGQMRP
jgi:hypothetical protein